MPGNGDPAAPAAERFVIEGGHPLKGRVTAAGNKNEALPILAASLLVPGGVGEMGRFAVALMSDVATCLLVGAGWPSRTTTFGSPPFTTRAPRRIQPQDHHDLEGLDGAAAGRPVMATPAWPRAS